MSVQRRAGIMSAMQEEINGVEQLMDNVMIEKVGVHTYYSGTIFAIPVVLVFSGWGKVAAAATVSTLIHRFGVSEILFTGVAGAVAPDLRIGDIVLGERLVQHDMDARPLFQQFEIPLLKQSFFHSSPAILQRMKQRIQSLLETGSIRNLAGEETFARFHITGPAIIVGDIASGDQFINNSIQRDAITAALPTVVCVEMEGAAVAQVCYENKIDFLVIRTISDTADELSHADFVSFVHEVSSQYSVEFIKHYFKQEEPSP